MPGAVIGNPTPAWLKPENASVLDPLYMRFVRAMASAVGADDPQSQVLGLQNPMSTVAIGLVQPERTSQLLRRLASYGAPEEFTQALTYMAERYPRLMSHVANVEPRAALNTDEKLAAYAAGEGTATMGRAQALGASTKAKQYYNAGVEHPGGRVAQIAVDSRTVKTSGDHVRVLAHEADHVAQNLRQTDRAWRTYDAPTFNEEYSKLHTMAGYERNPYERAAREVGYKHGSESAVIRQARKYLDSGLNPEQATEKLLKLIRLTLELNDATDPKQVRRLVNVAQTMSKRAQE